MTAIDQRIRKLEIQAGISNAQLIVYSAADDASDEDAAAFLASNGITPKDADLVVCVRRFKAADQGFTLDLVKPF